MTRAYSTLGEGVTLNPPEGGPIRCGSGPVAPPVAVTGTREGVAFGPLLLSVPPESRLQVDRLMFMPSETDDDLLVFGGLAAGGTAGHSAPPRTRPDGDDAGGLRTTRRGVLALATGLLATAAAGTVSAQDGSERVSLAICEADVEAFGPVSVSVMDTVRNVLPPETDVLIDADGVRRGSMAAPRDVVTLPPRVRTVTVYLQTARERLPRLLAWARGLLPTDAPIEISGELPQPASEYDSGHVVTLSSHQSLVGPIEDSGPDATAVSIGGGDVPHGDVTGGDLGVWDVTDGEVVHKIGAQPPTAAEWSVVTRLGPIQRLLE